MAAFCIKRARIDLPSEEDLIQFSIFYMIKCATCASDEMHKYIFARLGKHAVPLISKIILDKSL